MGDIIEDMSGEGVEGEGWGWMNSGVRGNK